MVKVIRTSTPACDARAHGQGSERRRAHLAQTLLVLSPGERVRGQGRPMQAVTWHGKRDVRVDTVPDPIIQEPTDAIVRITTTAICGSDLHLYEVLPPFMTEGDILGHEPMGIVEEVGSGVTNLARGRSE